MLELNKINKINLKFVREYTNDAHVRKNISFKLKSNQKGGTILLRNRTLPSIFVLIYQKKKNLIKLE